MDELLREFLTETSESLDVVDVELVRFEQEPNNAKILDNIFRLVHTIKGTCGFLGLPRLEALAHAAEALMGKFRDGMPVTGEAVTLILSTIDRIKGIPGASSSATGGASRATISDLIAQLERMSSDAATAQRGRARPHRRLAGAADAGAAAASGRGRRSTSSSARSARRPVPSVPRPRRVRHRRSAAPQRGRARHAETPPATTTVRRQDRQPVDPRATSRRSNT